MSAVADTDGLPATGKSLMVLAFVGEHEILHFRIFDAKGETLFDIAENQLPAQASQIGILRYQLKSLRPPGQPSTGEKNALIAAVASILGYDPVSKKNVSHPERVQTRWGDDEGYYFGVADRMAELPPDWIHCADRRSDIPKDACYWAGCGGKFVWVGQDGMAGLSQFLLILQQIARADFGSTHFPRTQTRTIQKDFLFKELGKNYVATATIYLDENGLLTPGLNQPPIPSKTRVDNVGKNADLRSVINASAKSSSP